MKKRGTSNIFIILTIAAILGFGTYAFAHMSMGYGPSGWGGHMAGWHHRGYYGQGYGEIPNLTDEQIDKLEKERANFFENTKELRDAIYAKELEIRSEFAKSDVNETKVPTLQKELSKLRTELDQKHIDHIINVRKINPKIARGQMGPGNMGNYYASYGQCWE